MTDTHLCINEQACRGAQVVNGIRRPALTIEQHELCDACRTDYAKTIRQLARDYGNLERFLGETQNGTGAKVRSTPTPGIPINAGAEALMAAIVETTDRAAAIVAAQLTISHPDVRRAAPKIKGAAPQYNSIADHVGSLLIRPRPYQHLTACINLIEPHIDVLAEAPTETQITWGDIPDTTAKWTPETGQPRWTGQTREYTETSGLELLQTLRDLHHQTRAHLGHTRLRHRYNMPCPAYDRHGNYCGAMTVGRDDGNDWVNCTTCNAQWTEREFNWLKTMIAGDKEIDMLRYLLAEAYWRLDRIQNAVNALTNDDNKDLPGAGTIILEHLTKLLEGHPSPQERKTT